MEQKLVNLLSSISEVSNAMPDASKQSRGIVNNINNFEDLILHLFKTNEIVYHLTNRTKEKIINHIKKNDYNECFEHDLLENNKIYYVAQPFGSQKFPDYILTFKLESQLIWFNIECKSIKNNRNPVWNCSLPNRDKNTIYLIKSEAGIIAIAGSDLITETEYEQLLALKQAILELPQIKDLNENLTRWSYYPRLMFNQKFNIDFTQKENYFTTIKTNISDTMDIYNKNYNNNSITFQKEISIETRKKYGQYMTPRNIRAKLFKKLSKLHIKGDIRILEPSFGTGEFLQDIIETFPKSKVTGYDIDPIFFDKFKFKFPQESESSLFELRDKNLKNKDFLLSKSTKTFDLIIGNPPYFELGKERSKYKETDLLQYISGRTNIYVLFILRCIQLLNDSGILAFIIPNSLKSSPTLNKVREFITQNCTILCIDNLDNFSTNVGQDVMLFICRKVLDTKKRNTKFTIKLNNDIIFTKYELSDYNGTISQTGCTISTGSIVWNQYKSILTNKERGNLFLFYNDNIKTGFSVVTTRKNPDKKQFIKKKYYKGTIINSPCIIISRVNGSGRNVNLNLVLLENKEKKSFVAENHVNVILHSDFDILKKIFDTLCNPKTIEFLKECQGTLNISATQLSNIPFW